LATYPTLAIEAFILSYFFQINMANKALNITIYLSGLKVFIS